MTALDVACLVVAVLGVAFGIRSYVELWRWAKQCQRARIAIAFRQRVQIQAPLVEWLGWANQLARDEAASGRVVYRNGKVSVAILRRGKEPSRFGFIRDRLARRSPSKPTPHKAKAAR